MSRCAAAAVPVVLVYSARVGHGGGFGGRKRYLVCRVILMLILWALEGGAAVSYSWRVDRCPSLATTSYCLELLL